MKRLLVILTAMILLPSSVANPNLWMHRNNPHQIITNVKSTNEDVEDIANKLFAKTIKIDPSFWLDKDIKTDSSQFNAAIVKAGILTQDEAQYVSWNSLNIDYAGWYWNKGVFTVSKDGATATGYLTINAGLNETMQQIATKLENATINFNYNYWNNKAIQNYSSEIQNILVNEKILTKTEASDVGVDVPLTITSAGQLTTSFDVNDDNTEATASVKLNVNNDGNSAAEIASSIQNTAYGLKLNTVGKYGDDQTITQNFQNLLVNAYNQDANDMQYVSLPHVKLQQDNKNMNAQVMKDGQLATALVDVQCKQGSYIYYQMNTYTDFQAYVNLTPQFLSYLKPFFKENPHLQLLYFYQMLNDGKLHDPRPYYDFPRYTGPDYLDPANILELNMDGFGYDGTPRNLYWLSQWDFNEAFLNDLYNQVMASKDGYLSVMFHWHFNDPDDVYSTPKYSFW